MRLLHLSRCNDHFVLWGETSDDTHRAEDQAAHALPYACTSEALTSVLHDPSAADDIQVTAWLPTRDGGPVPSTPLISEGPTRPDDADASSIALDAWSIPGCRLSTEATIDLLRRCHDRRMLEPGLRIGDDVAYWTAVLRFADALVAREQFLPGITSRDGHFFAIWDPVLQGDETERLVRLATAMPDACRALSDGANAPPDTPPRTLVRTVLAHIVNRLVRDGLASPAASRSARAFDSLHAQWLHHLRTPDGRLEGPSDALERLSGQLRAWRHRLAVTTDAPFRLVFRLEAPEAEPVDGDAPPDEALADLEDVSWYVQYVLQSTTDPSLQVPVERIWSGEAALEKTTEHADVPPQTYLLAAFGQAMGVWPTIEDTLKDPDPSGVTLSTEEAYAFLTEHAPLLRQAGFGVQLPSWWTRGRTRRQVSTRARATPAMQAKSNLSLDSIVSFEWDLVLGDHVLSREELQALAEMKTPLVRLRGEWVEVDLDALRDVADRLSGPDETFTARDLIHMHLGAEPAPGGLSVDDIEADGWLRDVLDRLDGDATLDPVPTPEGFQGTLRPYQQRGLAWLSFLRRLGFGACLADDMGLGKTIQALALLQNAWTPEDDDPTPHRPSLVVCPTSVVGNWKKEAERFVPDLPARIHHGGDRVETRDAFQKQADAHALLITNYALLRRDIDLFEDVAWSTVVLDEAQYIKNPRTQRAQAARSLQADHRIAMTGTPVENNVGELWSIMEFLNPGLLGSQASFKKQFFRPIQNERDEEAMRRLKRITGPFILRRHKNDPAVIDDLPEKQEMRVYTTLTEEQASLYKAVVDETNAALDDVEGMDRRGLVLSTLTQLKQICNHPAQYLHDDSSLARRSGKLTRLVEMLEEIVEADERALLFTQYTEMGDMLKRHLQTTFGREALFLHGGVDQDARNRMVDRFQTANDAPPFFLLSLKAGGTGLNLTRANHVFHYDRWWNPAVENQATDRAFRIGQSRDVQVHKFVCVGTVEERIDEMIERKQALAEEVVDTGEAWITELSTNELRDLFTLREDAVA